MYVKTQRLELKPITPAAMPALMELLTDDVVKKTYMLPDFTTREDAWKLADRILRMSEDPQMYVAGVYREAELIGLLNKTEVEGDCIELGYAILPRFHNRGYCTEALTGAIAELFAQGFRRVVAGAFEDNAASIRVMVKSGMHRIDRVDSVDYRGKTRRCVYYQAEKNELSERQTKNLP